MGVLVSVMAVTLGAEFAALPLLLLPWLLLAVVIAYYSEYAIGIAIGRSPWADSARGNF